MEASGHKAPGDWRQTLPQVVDSDVQFMANFHMNPQLGNLVYVTKYSFSSTPGESNL